MLLDVETRQCNLEKETKEKGLEPPKTLTSDIQTIKNQGKKLVIFSFKYNIVKDCEETDLFTFLFLLGDISILYVF